MYIFNRVFLLFEEAYLESTRRADSDNREEQMRSFKVNRLMKSDRIKHGNEINVGKKPTTCSVRKTKAYNSKRFYPLKLKCLHKYKLLI